MSARVWVPATTALLARWSAAGEVPAGQGHAVTSALRQQWPDGEDEEWEYAVLLAAAEEAASLLEAPGRRVVVVVETGDVRELEGTRVEFGEPAAWRRVKAVHADPVGARIQPGAPAEGEADLGWYAVQEVPDLLDSGPR
jgi:hypothetical protein